MGSGDTSGDATGGFALALVVHKAAELDDVFEGLDADRVGLHGVVGQQSAFHFGGDDGGIHVFAGAAFGGGASATAGEETGGDGPDQRTEEQEAGGVEGGFHGSLVVVGRVKRLRTDHRKKAGGIIWGITRTPWRWVRAI